MNRRAALSAFAAAALAPATLVRAADRVRTVGVLTPNPSTRYLAARLAGLGWIEGKNIRYEAREVPFEGTGADAAAAELVRLGVDVLVTSGATRTLALNAATRTIPIVTGGISDPVGEGVARSLQQPGFNVTGLSFGLPEAAQLQIGTLRAMVPGLKRVLFITTEADKGGVGPLHEAAAARYAISTSIAKVRDMAQLESTLAALGRPEAEAAWLADLPKDAAAERVAEAAARRRIATHCRKSDLVRRGFLMSYWIVHSDAPRRLAAIIDKVLRGEDPGRIPFELPDKTDFVLNRATARAIGVRVPEEVFLRATEVIG